MITEHKGFKIEKLDSENYVVYFSETLGDNVVHSDIEKLKEYIDNKIQREAESKKHKEKLEAEEKKKALELAEKEKYLNKFIAEEGIFYKKLPFEKVVFFLKDTIKTRFNGDNLPFMWKHSHNIKNYQQIEHLNNNGLKAVKENDYRAEFADGSFFKIKKTEYEYLKFLNNQEV